MVVFKNNAFYNAPRPCSEFDDQIIPNLWCRRVRLRKGVRLYWIHAGRNPQDAFCFFSNFTRCEAGFSAWYSLKPAPGCMNGWFSDLHVVKVIQIPKKTNEIKLWNSNIVCSQDWTTAPTKSLHSDIYWWNHCLRPLIPLLHRFGISETFQVEFASLRVILFACDQRYSKQKWCWNLWIAPLAKEFDFSELIWDSPDCFCTYHYKF